MTNLDVLPRRAKNRALELIANEERGQTYKSVVHCAHVAAYIGGLTSRVDAPNDENMEKFRFYPQDLLGSIQTENPQPGDIAVFNKHGLPEHFAIVLGNGQYFSKLGQDLGFPINTEQELKDKYKCDSVDYFRTMIWAHRD